MIEFVNLYNYRNIRRAELQLHPRLNVFVGANAQGKTNLLESLSFLLRRRSFRLGSGEVFVGKAELTSPAPHLDFRQDGGLELGAQARLKACLKPSVNLPSIDLEVCWQGAQKKHFINNKAWGIKKIQAKAIVFTPESLLLLQGSPHGRRDFMDELGAEYFEARSTLVEFNRCLKSRNQQLKKLKSLGQQVSSQQLKLLAVLDRQFLDLSVQLSCLRQRALKLLQGPFFKLCFEVFGAQKLDICMEYLVSSKSALEWSENKLRGVLRQKMADVAGAEQQLGHSLAGPQKHDFRLSVLGHDARYYCSQGQQRALVLALKMAQQQVYGEKFSPVLLLDDVFSELDAQKRHWLIEYLRRTQVQAFVSTTDCDLPQRLGPDMLVFQVERGKVSPYYA